MARLVVIDQPIDRPEASDVLTHQRLVVTTPARGGLSARSVAQQRLEELSRSYCPFAIAIEQRDSFPKEPYLRLEQLQASTPLTRSAPERSSIESVTRLAQDQEQNTALARHRPQAHTGLSDVSRTAELSVGEALVEDVASTSVPAKRNIAEVDTENPAGDASDSSLDSTDHIPYQARTSLEDVALTRSNPGPDTYRLNRQPGSRNVRSRTSVPTHLPRRGVPRKAALV